jgi:hypothetical protein
MLGIKGVEFSLFKYSLLAFSQVMKINYRGKTNFGKERKISKFYQALVTGILDNDEVLSFPPYSFVMLF